MRRFLLFASLIVILLILAGAGMGIALANSAPFRPGEALFPLQNFSEQATVTLASSQAGKADFLIRLMERRTADLGEVTGTNQEEPVLLALVKALNQAAQAIALMPEKEAASLRSQFAASLRNAHTAISRLVILPVKNPELVAGVQSKIQTLMMLLMGGQPLAVSAPQAKLTPTALLPIPSLTIVPTAVLTATVSPALMVYFPPGSPGAIHAFYPLTGGHATLDCVACHTQGIYLGTPSTCSACHAKDEPANHYPGDCSACHTTASWKDIHFDHAVAKATDCVSCHTKDAPANHFSGQCSLCHTTGAWLPATFNHQAVGATDCLSCHTKDKPAGHYDGQCSFCHNTTNWNQATFNHQAVGATDCVSCHSKNAPAGHFSGQCSACHNTSAWLPATFNHQAVGATDCISCHTKDKPANHFSGQCSACHSTSAWKPATFNHQAAGATDCAACHAKDAPAGHPGGQCSQCHTTSAWSPSTFAHSFPISHGGANGNCSTCHPSGYNSYTCFSCHNQQEMADKHSGVSGYSNDCTSCHPNGTKGGD